MLNQCKLVRVVIVIGSIMLVFTSFCYAFVRTLAIWLLSHLFSSWLWLLILVSLHHTCSSYICWSKVFPLDDFGYLFFLGFFLAYRSCKLVASYYTLSFFWAQVTLTFYHAHAIKHCVVFVLYFHFIVFVLNLHFVMFGLCLHLMVSK
jgi:hypothetical protein